MIDVARRVRGLALMAIVGSVMAATLPAAAIADPAPFATASANCSSGEIDFPAQTSAHSDVLVEFQAVGSSGAIAGPDGFSPFSPLVTRAGARRRASRPELRLQWV